MPCALDAVQALQIIRTLCSDKNTHRLSYCNTQPHT